MIGHIDKVTNSIIAGWACSSFEAKKDLLRLYINDEFIKEFTPDIVRQGLVDKGIHHNGACAFRVNIEDLSIDLKKEHKISVRIFMNGAFVDLDNSPVSFQPKEWIEGLITKAKETEGTKILIVGLPKSGTTALTYSLENAFPKSTVYFEPNQNKGLLDVEFHARVCSQNQDVISKCLYVGDKASSLTTIERFYDKCIWIHRDPRDWVISNFLYVWYHAHNLPSESFDKALSETLKKEIAPASIDFLPLLELERGFNYYCKALGKCADELQRVADGDNWYILRFEDFLDGNFDALNTYLGKDISRTKSLPKSLKRVERAIAHGYWRDWFTEADQKVFNENLEEVMTAMRYDISEKLNDSPSIDPKFSSEYMQKINSGTLK
ncbi:MAG: hypothetical protein AAGA77_12540 [Bacteroidota bacterium]